MEQDRGVKARLKGEQARARLDERKRRELGRGEGQRVRRLVNAHVRDAVPPPALRLGVPPPDLFFVCSRAKGRESRVERAQQQDRGRKRRWEGTRAVMQA